MNKRILARIETLHLKTSEEIERLTNTPNSWNIEKQTQSMEVRF